MHLFDLTGRTVATLVDEQLAPSGYRVAFEAGGVAQWRVLLPPAGARRFGAGFVETRKLTLLN